MCVTNIYTDVYPDGTRKEFHQTTICQYGMPGRPCSKHSTLTNPVRRIQWGEPSTEYMLTSASRIFPQAPQTPPRSSGSSHRHRSVGSHHRRSGGYASSSDGGERRRKHSKHPSPTRASRSHRKERIVIVDAPPTPCTPPQLYGQTFTAPNSPSMANSRPVIVDERKYYGAAKAEELRVPSVEPIREPSPRRYPGSTPRAQWESPSTSHTTFDLRARLEAETRAIEERRRRQNERQERLAELEAERRRRDFIAAQDEEIRRRPAVPLRQRSYALRSAPVIEQQGRIESGGLVSLMSGLSLSEKERERVARERMEEEQLKQRLRERQMPRRRFSVGPAQRRTRVLYDDGVYRWE